eukprot:gb/GECH01009481.1/.p1 GENE.gb/GECH01009481.1/~~gb/GECH01009481.1/.p1  ORF type:complete len:354 (+),score=141.98 gb/GECH01009481.1/:1-1062(+)
MNKFNERGKNRGNRGRGRGRGRGKGRGRGRGKDGRKGKKRNFEEMQSQREQVKGKQREKLDFYVEKFRHLLKLELDEEKKVVNERLKNYSKARLSREGLAIFGVQGAKRGTFFGKKILQFKNPNVKELPYFRISSGSVILISRKDPIAEHPLQGLLLSCSRRLLRIAVDTVPRDIRRGSWRIDGGVNTVAYDRMEKALKSMYHVPKRFDYGLNHHVLIDNDNNNSNDNNTDKVEVDQENNDEKKTNSKDKNISSNDEPKNHDDHNSKEKDNANANGSTSENEEVNEKIKDSNEQSEEDSKETKNESEQKEEEEEKIVELTPADDDDLEDDDEDDDDEEEEVWMMMMMKRRREI